jgi:hypothetical protein
LLQKEGSFSAAYNKIEDKIDELKGEDSDVYQRIHMLVLKALFLSNVGKPSKGFTIALRAAAMAFRANLLPALWEAVGALANILSALREFDTARALLDAVIPQVEFPFSCDSMQALTSTRHSVGVTRHYAPSSTFGKQTPTWDWRDSRLRDQTIRQRSCPNRRTTSIGLGTVSRPFLCRAIIFKR